MKKSLLITTSLLTLGVVTGIYAQSVGATGSIVDKMKAVAHSFTLGSTLNPTDTGLTSDPVKGKKTGDILTAGEYNRLLELVSEGGVGGSVGGDGSIKARITYRNLGGTVTTVGNSYGVQSVTNGASVTNFLNYDTIVTFTNPILDGNYSVIASPAFNSGSGYYEGKVLDWVCIWSKISATSLGVHCAYPGYGAYGNSIVSVVVIGDGGAAAGSGGLALYKCTNAQSLDVTNAPCYGASRNGGAGTNQYRVVSCTDNDGTRSYTMSSILNFGQLVANKWAVSVNGGTIECDDGTVLVMDTQSGGSGGSTSSSWVDVLLTDTADFDVSCEYRAYVPKNAQQTENSWQYFIGVTPKRLRSAPSNDSEVYIPNNDKKAFYITPYGRADAWGLLVTKIQKRCN